MKRIKYIKWNGYTKALLVAILSLMLLMGFSLGMIVRGLSYPKIESYYIHPRVMRSAPCDTLAQIAPVTYEVIEVTEVTEVVETPEVIEVIEYYDCPLDDDLQDYIRELCDKKGVPMSLIIAMIEVESSFKANIISRTNDYGLMQINKINHEWLSEAYGITDFLDPYQNVFCGITVISQHYNRFKDVDKALMAYNLGANGAKRLWNKGTYETSYTRHIKRTMEVYENEIE